MRPQKLLFITALMKVSGHQRAEDDTTPTCHNSRAAEAHPTIKEKNRTAKIKPTPKKMVTC